MKQYIDANKIEPNTEFEAKCSEKNCPYFIVWSYLGQLRAELKKRLKNVRDYMNGAGMKYKGPKYFKAQGKESAYDALLSIITSLQQGQQEPTCKTCDYYENDCPFTRGKFIVYPNKVCKNYKEQSHFADVGKMERPEGGCSGKPNDLLSERAKEDGRSRWNMEAEIDAYFDKVGMPVFWCNDDEQRDFCAEIARHFYELGLNARKV